LPITQEVMRTEFISEPVEVARDEDKPGKPPVLVTWRGEDWPVERVEAVWHDTSWGTMKPGAGRWWQRRHRTYFQVTVRGGRIFELYYDRGANAWTLYRILHPEPAAG